MSWRLTIFTGMAALACAVVVFEFKGTVRTIDRQIVSTNREIEQQRWRLQTLRADYAYLTRPERLAMQAAQLGMVPASTRQMTQVTSIAFDSQVAFAGRALPVTLPGGETVELRFKPTSASYAAGEGEGADQGDVAAAAAGPSAARASQQESAEAPPAHADREQVATATPAKSGPAAAKAEQSASSRAIEAAKATKAAQAALAARIAQATARRGATVAPQKSSPAPLWAGSPPRQNNLP